MREGHNPYPVTRESIRDIADDGLSAMQDILERVQEDIADTQDADLLALLSRIEAIVRGAVGELAAFREGVGAPEPERNK